MSANASNGHEVIIVCGLPRTGTSMMMKMLAAGGVPLLTDDVRQADDDNPEGYFEFERVKQLITGDTAWLPLAEGKAVKVVSELALYLPASHAYRVIFMERNLQEVLTSQATMLAHRGNTQPAIDDARIVVAYEKHIAQIKLRLSQRGNMSVLYVPYRAVLHTPAVQAPRIRDFLDLPLEVERMIAVVNTRLYRNRMD